MANDMFSLLVVRGAEKSIDIFKQETAYVWSLGTYKGSAIYVDRLQVRKEADGVLALSFVTDESPPMNAVKKMSWDYHDLVFELTYEDEQVRYYDDICKDIPKDEVHHLCGTAIFSWGECISITGGDNWCTALNALCDE